MNCYVVRIYRETANKPRNFVGIVEEVGAGEKKAFTSLDELWMILNPAGRRGKQNSSKKQSLEKGGESVKKESSGPSCFGRR